MPKIHYKFDNKVIADPNNKVITLLFNLDGDRFELNTAIPCPISYLVLEYPTYESKKNRLRDLEEQFRDGKEIVQIRAIHNTKRNIFVMFGDKDRIQDIQFNHFFIMNPDNELERNIPVIWGYGTIGRNGTGIRFTKRAVDYIHYPRGFEYDKKVPFEGPPVMGYLPRPEFLTQM